MQQWLSLREAADFFGCHYSTLLRNWPKIPKTDRVKTGTQKWIWGGTSWRPNGKAGRPVTTYGGRTTLPQVREALPGCPHDLSTVTADKRELWMAKVDAVLESSLR